MICVLLSIWVLDMEREEQMMMSTGMVIILIIYNSQGFHDAKSTDGQEEPTDRGIPTGRSDYEVTEVYAPPSTFSMLGQRKSKLTAATLAGLQQKEMLKTRKRQLTAVLGALSHGDALALDQALSTNYPLAGSGLEDLKNGELPRVRLSRRRVVRMARVARRHPRHPDQVPFPVCNFSFVCPSASEWWYSWFFPGPNRCQYLIFHWRSGFLFT